VEQKEEKESRKETEKRCELVTIKEDKERGTNTHVLRD
jgi:hypothetical protein